MKKNKKISNKELILHEWQWIYANFPKFYQISDVKMPSVSTSSIGHQFEHFKRNNYKSRYNDAVEKENYSIYLNDDSIIYFYYVFDTDGKIVGHNLAYIPSLNDENPPYGEELLLSRYLRADYDKTGYKSIVHTLVHLHIGIYDSKFRIPIAHYLSPYDFLYIILKYIYHSNQEIIDKLINIKQKDFLLSNEEMKK